jgi:hypothetical protein
MMLATVAIAQTPPPELDAALEVLDRLDRVAITAEYAAVPLTQAIVDLATRLPVPVRVDWRALDRLGVDDDDEITLTIDRANGNSALASMAFCLGDELERPIFEVHAGQLVLTTIEGSAAMRLTTAYDVRDLLANAGLVEQLRNQRPQPQVGGEARADPPELPQVHPIPEPLGQPPGHEGEHDELPRPPAENAAAPERQPTPGEQLLWLITDHVDPEAWMNYGGNRALITEIDGVLMVTATPRTHRLLRQALQQLRRANPAMISLTAMIIDIPRASHQRLARQHDSDSAAFAAALRARSDARIVWSADQPIAVGSELNTLSRAAGIEVNVSVKPSFDQARGILVTAVNASTTAGDDHRQVNTTLALHPGHGCAIVDLPGAQSSEIMRLVVLSVTRR